MNLKITLCYLFFTIFLIGCKVKQVQIKDFTLTEVKLQTGTITPTATINEEVLNKIKDGRVYVILQFKEDPDPRLLRKLKIIVVNSLGQNTIIASLPKGFNYKKISNIAWLGELSGELKISQIAKEKMELLNEEKAQTFIIEAFSGIQEKELVEVLEKYDLKFEDIPKFPKRVKKVIVKDKLLINKLADENIIYYISAISPDSQEYQLYYCPGPVTENGYLAHFATVGSGWPAQGQAPCLNLNYHFQNGTPDIAEQNEQNEVRLALCTWAKVTDICFSEISFPNEIRSIDFLWGSRDHGDGSPFDGPNGVLAHAYYPNPPNSETIAGDVHFDEDENWSETGNIHMFTVALHEIGHSLGLGHSNEPGAVMAAFYNGPITRLHQDDIDGIQALYTNSKNCQKNDTDILTKVGNSIRVRYAKCIPFRSDCDWETIGGTSVTLNQMRFGDFDGDGRTDILTKVGNSIRVRYAKCIPFRSDCDWETIGGTSVTLNQMRFGDFDGDGRTDILTKAGNSIRVRYAKCIPFRSDCDWETIGGTSVTLNQMRFGDFDGDGRTDILTKVGNSIRVRYAKCIPFRSDCDWETIGGTSVTLNQMRFGDFDGDGRTDILTKVGNSIRVRYAKCIPFRSDCDWETIGGTSVTLNQMRFGDFDGDGRTDILTKVGNSIRVRYAKCIPFRSDCDWETIGGTSVTLNQMRFGDFDGGCMNCN